MEKIKTLPRKAKYDYTDVFGDMHYHTERKIYIVRVVGAFGNPCYKKTIWSKKR